MKILCVVASPRYVKISDDRLDKFFNDPDVMKAAYEIGYEGKVSNSQVLLLAGAWKIKKEGFDIEFLYPGDKIPEFDGALLSSPVYFGDRSSYLHDFITTANLKDKGVAAVVSGAKRNGGQETTIVYALYDCLIQGSLITGNGPPEGQYGGTGWAGNKTAIVNDDFGIKTSAGTGSQLSKLTRMIHTEEDTQTPNILFVVVNKGELDFPHKLFKNCNVDVLNISSSNIRRCIACPVCPNGNLENDFTCILNDDDMRELHTHIRTADCVILASNLSNDLLDMYQIFIERSRFIRRHHFELAERPYSSVSNTFSVTDIFPLRAMTSMIRQNMYCIPFFRNSNNVSNMSISDYVKMIESYTRKSMTMRKITKIDSIYTPVGYADAKQRERAYRD